MSVSKSVFCMISINLKPSTVGFHISKFVKKPWSLGPKKGYNREKSKIPCVLHEWGKPELQYKSKMHKIFHNIM